MRYTLDDKPLRLVSLVDVLGDFALDPAYESVMTVQARSQRGSCGLGGGNNRLLRVGLNRNKRWAVSQLEASHE
jgi:hypothetical protein